MLSVSNVMEELSGNGFTQAELFEISKELTVFTISRTKLQKKLVDLFDEEELEQILMTIEVASYQEAFLSDVHEVLSFRENQCYMKHAAEGMSFSSIAKELGVSKSTVQQCIERSREKIEMLKEGRTFVRTGKKVRFLPEKKN